MCEVKEKRKTKNEETDVCRGGGQCGVRVERGVVEFDKISGLGSGDENWVADNTTINADRQFTTTTTGISDFTTGKGEYAYFAIVNGDNIYLSNAIQAGYSNVGEVEKYTFSWSETSQAKAMKAAGEGYVGAGWYNVPEPTSGLLLLLGVAGLALKRRRA